MNSTDKYKEAEQIIMAIQTALDDQLIAQRIDGPIDLGLQTFHYEASSTISSHEFHRIITEFTQHLYDTVLKSPWKMSCQDPFTHALSLLENYYQGTYSQGYMGAWLDTEDEHQNGMDTVLHRLAEAVKAMEHQEYIHWVFTAHYESLPWEKRCAVAEIWLQEWRSFLPPKLQCRSASEMIKVIPSLMQSVRGIDGAIQQISQP